MMRFSVIPLALLVLVGPALSQIRTLWKEYPGGQLYMYWEKTDKGYYFAEYNLKSNPRGAYDHKQYVIYKPSVDKNWVYWYNPATGKFWARCPTKNHPTLGKAIMAGKDIWAVLPADAVKPGKVDDAIKADYPEAKEMSPKVPGADKRPGDKRTIPCLPPDDLPE